MAKKKLVKGSWTQREIRLLEREFPKRPCAKVAEMLGRPLYAVKKKASRMHLRKSRRYLKSLGRS
jgi:hypothetical protein